ncbi:MAG: carbohydrate kinase [Chloroflexi bacterium]|nr:MAG: carbohydrate kinase [Chloroflexota bacterium]MBL1193806.1 carbohydrate kinase [Chloroflexota bacterium]NOH11099.1 carbohydrate kinase [Chloroflexota bacterium]
MSSTYLLGIDNGTTTTKATLFDTEGNEIAVSSGKDVKVSHPKPAWAEENMDDIWQATAAAIRNCIETANVTPAEIAGVSLSGHGGGVYLIDGEGTPVRNAIIWLDGRANSYVEAWNQDQRGNELYDASGWALFAGIGPVTIFPWLMENEPESLKKAKYNLTSKGWVKYKLTGEINVDSTMASIGLVDYATGDYSQKVLELAGIDQYKDLLPPIIKPWEVAGHVTSEAAALTGLAEGTPVAGGAWDGASSTLGAGCIGVGEAASVVATAGVHVVVSEAPDLDEERNYSLMYHTVPNMYIKNSLSQLAAGNLDWFEKQFCSAQRAEAEKRGISVYDVINEIAAEVPVGAGGVMYLPFLQGERAPFVKMEARGEFFGLGDWHTPAHLLRAVYEGVALSTRDNYECMQKGKPLETTFLTGGGSHSPLWCQILADCTGNAMKVPAGKDSGSRGAAMNAGVAVGVFSDHADAVKNMVQIRDEYPADVENTKKYDQLYSLYSELIQQIWPMWEKRAELGVESWE